MLFSKQLQIKHNRIFLATKFRLEITSKIQPDKNGIQNAPDLNMYRDTIFWNGKNKKENAKEDLKRDRETRKKDATFDQSIDQCISTHHGVSQEILVTCMNEDQRMRGREPKNRQTISDIRQYISMMQLLFAAQCQFFVLGYESHLADFADLIGANGFSASRSAKPFEEDVCDAVCVVYEKFIKSLIVCYRYLFFTFSAKLLYSIAFRVNYK